MTRLAKEREAELQAKKNAVQIVKRNDLIQTDSLPLKVYHRRWLILALFMFYAGGSTFQWIEYSIISNIVSRYYNVSSIAVDWTALSYMLYYVALIFPASYFIDRFGLRWTAILGSSISCLGAWVKIFSVAPDRFYVTFIGQSLGASSQVLILSVPGHLAAYWFDAGELSTATSLGIFGTLVGVSAGFLITPIIVRNHENLDDIGEDLSRLYWYIAVITTVGFILVVLFFQDEPKLPPSKTRAIQKANRNDTKESFLRSMKRLITNKSYLLLCNSYGMNIGAFNVVATLLNQIYLTHFENGEKDAGRIGLAIVVMGMMGSVTFGVILDKTHRFKETAVTVYFLALCGQILFAVFLYLELKWMVYASAMFLGFFMSGYLSLGYELCAEYTYPEAEGVSTGFLNIANNVYGMVLVIILGKLMEVYGDVVVHAGLCTALLIGFVLTVLTKDEQRRQDARRAALYQSVPTKEADTARQNP